MGPMPMRFGPGGPLFMGVHFSWYTGTSDDAMRSNRITRVPTETGKPGSENGHGTCKIYKKS